MFDSTKVRLKCRPMRGRLSARLRWETPTHRWLSECAWNYLGFGLRILLPRKLLRWQRHFYYDREGDLRHVDPPSTENTSLGEIIEYLEVWTYGITDRRRLYPLKDSLARIKDLWEAELYGRELAFFLNY
jgi:hypothetical protein